MLDVRLGTGLLDFTFDTQQKIILRNKNGQQKEQYRKARTARQPTTVNLQPFFPTFAQK